MATTEMPGETPRVACEICLKEVPQSEAINAEAVDYVAYFCGIDCYRRWVERVADSGASKPGKSERELG
ncbi:MAG: DUF3330 domain-containing protein [Burkholderiaceae bacterium]